MVSHMTLTINTSKPEAVISLTEDDAVVAERRFEANPTLGRQLLEQLDDMLVGLSKTKQDITAITVAPGPGHFMALRTGIVTAQTLAHGLGLPLPKVQPRYE